jgi:hypothetical protein
LAKKTEGSSTSARVGEKIESFAEDLGKLLGTAQAKASSWLEQRKSIADQLTQIRDTANEYLQRLSGEAASVAAAVRRGARRGRPPGSKNKTAGAKKGEPGRPPGSGKKKGGMSAAGRLAVSRAQKKRWAKKRAEQAKAAKAKGGGEVGNGCSQARFGAGGGSVGSGTSSCSF